MKRPNNMSRFFAIVLAGAFILFPALNTYAAPPSQDTPEPDASLCYRGSPDVIPVGQMAIEQVDPTTVMLFYENSKGQKFTLTITASTEEVLNQFLYPEPRENLAPGPEQNVAAAPEASLTPEQSENNELAFCFEALGPFIPVNHILDNAVRECTGGIGMTEVVQSALDMNVSVEEYLANETDCPRDDLLALTDQATVDAIQRAKEAGWLAPDTNEEDLQQSTADSFAEILRQPPSDQKDELEIGAEINIEITAWPIEGDMPEDQEYVVQYVFDPSIAQWAVRSDYTPSTFYQMMYETVGADWGGVRAIVGYWSSDIAAVDSQYSGWQWANAVAATGLGADNYYWTSGTVTVW